MLALRVDLDPVQPRLRHHASAPIQYFVVLDAVSGVIKKMDLKDPGRSVNNSI